MYDHCNALYFSSNIIIHDEHNIPFVVGVSSTSHRAKIYNLPNANVAYLLYNWLIRLHKKCL